MKKATLIITVLFLFSTAPFGVQNADAQSRTRGGGTVKKSKRKVVKKRTTRTTRTRRHHRTHPRRHHTRRAHRHHSGAHVYWRFGWPYNSRYHHRHHVHRHTVVYDRTPDVVIVEADEGFTMPGLECPIRTDEVRSGLQQWCATGRGTKHGPYRRWYDDGVLAAEGMYDYDVKDGVWVEFHPNGAIREEGAYKNGKRIGTWVTWGSDGEELVVVDY